MLVDADVLTDEDMLAVDVVLVNEDFLLADEDVVLCGETLECNEADVRSGFAFE